MSEHAESFGSDSSPERKIILPINQDVFYRGLMLMGRYMLSGVDAHRESYERRLDRLRSKLIATAAVKHEALSTQVETVNGMILFGTSVQKTAVGMDLETAEVVYANVLGPEIKIELIEPLSIELTVSDLASWVHLEASVRNNERRVDAFALAVAAQDLEPYTVRYID